MRAKGKKKKSWRMMRLKIELIVHFSQLAMVFFGDDGSLQEKPFAAGSHDVSSADFGASFS